MKDSLNSIVVYVSPRSFLAPPAAVNHWFVFYTVSLFLICCTHLLFYIFRCRIQAVYRM